MKSLNSYQFFLKHAGYSYDPKTQTAMQGRIQGARALAAAERKARDADISFKWSIDPDCTSAEFCAPSEDGGHNKAPWQTWQCVAYQSMDCVQSSARIVASLYGIDFGRNGEPWGDPHRRVVEAELALEALEVQP